MTEIRRARESASSRFVMIPNETARDNRLSRRARGLLAELLSHSAEWKTSERALAAAGPEGRDAIRTALGELREFGYLRTEPLRDASGMITGTVYEVSETPITDAEGAAAEDAAGEPRSDNPTTGGDQGRIIRGRVIQGREIQPHKKTNTKKTNSKKTNTPIPPEGAVTEAKMTTSEIELAGGEFYAAYPRKADPARSLAAFVKAVAKHGGKTRAEQMDFCRMVIGAARAHAADPNLPGKADRSEAHFVKHPATWLNAGAWANGPLPPRRGSAATGATAAESMLSDMESAEFGGSEFWATQREIAR